MKRAFASVADVVAAAESVWNETADGLSETGTAAGGREASSWEASTTTSWRGALAPAEDELGQLRDLLNTDPLALWHGGAGRHRPGWTGCASQAAAAAARAADLARLRADAAAADRRGRGGRRGGDSRPAGRRRRPGAGRSEDRRAPACRRCADAAGLEARLAALDELKAAGRWARLAAELDAIEAEAGRGDAAVPGCRAGGGGAAGPARRAARPARTPTRPRRRGSGAAEDAELDAALPAGP